MLKLILAFMLAASGDAIYLKDFHTTITLTADQRILLGNAINWTFGPAAGGTLDTADLSAVWCWQSISGTAGAEDNECVAEEVQDGITDAALLDLQLAVGNNIVSIAANGDNWDVVLRYDNGGLSAGAIYRHDLFTEDVFSADFLSAVIWYKCWRPDLDVPTIVDCRRHAIVTAAPSVWADDLIAGYVIQTLGKVP